MTRKNEYMEENSEESMLYELSKFPKVKQKKRFTCGPAALLSILRFIGIRGKSERELMKELGTNEADGTKTVEIVKTSKRYNLGVSIKYNLEIEDIERGMKRGNIYIVNYQLMRKRGRSWGETWINGHYSVVQGIDDNYIYLMDPWVGEVIRMKRERFEDRWHDTDKDGKSWGTAIVIKGEKDG